MRRPREILDRGMKSGVLPKEAVWPEDDARPWPVVLLTGLGAWLAAVPLLGVVSLLLGDLLRRGVGPYAVGLLVLAGAVTVLRSRQLALFVEQLAVPALLVGIGSLGFGLFRDLHEQGGSAALALLMTGLGVLLPQAWLRVLIGAAAAVCAAWAFGPFHGWRDGFAAVWWAWHASAALCAAGWGAAHWRARRGDARSAMALEPLMAGWLLAVAAGLAASSGMSFLVGASAGELGLLAHELGTRGEATGVLQALSVLLTLGGAALLARRWRSLRSATWAGVALALAVPAWFLPGLGAVLVAAAWCAGTQRWRLAGACALAAAWIVGSFYYRLQWPLSTKALVLVGVGAMLGALAWWAGRGESVASRSPVAAVPERGRWGFVIGAIGVLLVANAGVWQKEMLIAEGQPVFIELAPADPRSLMQGDYMRLNFRVPAEAARRLDSLVTSERPRVVARRDTRGVASLLRLDDGTLLGPGELRIELTPKDGRWTVVTDAWFFEEGQGRRYETAKYGEFRVGDDGRALLVGLRDAQLKPL